MRRVLAVLAMVVVGTAVQAGAAAAGGGGGDDLDCRDFPHKQAAQDHLDQDPADPDQLDGDGDGEACDEFAFAAGAAQATTPTTAATPTTRGRTATTAAPTTTAPAQPTTTTTRPMAHTGAATDRQGALAGAALATGLVLVMVSYTRTRRDRQML